MPHEPRLKNAVLRRVGNAATELSARAPGLANRAERLLLDRIIPNLADGAAYASSFRDLDPQSLTVAPNFALYAHVPFCASVCNYCVFNRSANHRLLPRYMDGLHDELRSYAGMPSVASAELSSLYIGGGTPTILSASALTDLFALIRGAYRLASDFQASLESTPDSLTSEKLDALTAAGLHRLSIGVQSFDDARLSAMGRLHSGRLAEDSVRAAISAGIPEVSIDLIYGLTGQTTDDFRADLARGVAAGATHISVFPLVPKGARGASLAEVQQQADMYRAAKRDLAELGFTQYSTDDFSLHGVECKYQTDAWRIPKKDLIGVGLGALSNAGEHFFTNVARLSEYVERIESGRHVVAGGKPIGPEEQARRAFMVGLKFLGVSAATLEETYAPEQLEALAPAIGGLRALGYAEANANGVSLTERGELFTARNSARLIIQMLDRFASAKPEAA